jgi:hypothetical protein
MSAKRPRGVGGGGARSAWRQRASVFGLDAGFQRADDRVGLGQPATCGEPARAFGEVPANPPDEYRAVRANEHDPAPARDAERVARH